MFRIAIATEQKYTDGGSYGPWYDDDKLRSALEARGHQVEIIDWQEPQFEASRFDAIFVSSTWDACDYPQQFTEWLQNCERDGRSLLINSFTVFEAGFTKYRYWEILTQILADNPDLQKIGQLTPSHFYQNSVDTQNSLVEQLAGRQLTDILTELDQDPLWNQANIVIKPVISADGKDTFVYNRFAREIPIDAEKRAQFILENEEEANAIFHRLATDIKRKGVILQTYMTGVEAGEYSLVFLDRQCTHAIQKPKLFKGDGSSRRRFIPLTQLPKKVLFFAEKIVELMNNKIAPGSITRARVDLFVQQERPILCEFECVDPNTNIKTVAKHDEALAEKIIQTYAQAIEKPAAIISSS